MGRGRQEPNTTPGPSLRGASGASGRRFRLHLYPLHDGEWSCDIEDERGRSIVSGEIYEARPAALVQAVSELVEVLERP